MNADFIIQAEEPLFPDLIWSRPETRQGAGKLLIIGGQAQEFAGVAQCFAAAEKAGAGMVRAVLPDSTRKATGMLPNIEYASSNQSGSFSAAALSELLEAASWADAVLLAGDLGKNSETALMLEKFINDFPGFLTIGGNSLESIGARAPELFKRENTLLSLNFNEMQKCVTELRLPTPLTSGTTNSQISNILKEVTGGYSTALIFTNGKSAWTTYKEKVALTLKSTASSELTSSAAVWSMQNPTKVFEAITTAAYC